MSKKENEKLIDRFYDEKVSAYDFVCLLIVVLKFYGIKSFKHADVEKTIIRCKKVGLYDELLQEINFESNGINEFSAQFQDAIRKAKFGKLLYSISPETDSTVHINKFINDFDVVELSKGKEKYVGLMNSFLYDSGILEFDTDEIKKNESQQFEEKRQDVAKVLVKVLEKKNNIIE